VSEIINWKALHTKVLVVAVKRVEGYWVAYIKNVPGESHERELDEVKAYGAKLMESIALAIFPMYEGIPYAW